MLSFLPIIGPLIQGISGIFTSFFNAKVQIKQAEVSQTIAETQASTAIIQATQDSIGLRLMRDIVCFPVVVWSALIGWDTIIGARQSNGLPWHPDWIGYMFHVGNYPPSVSYIPYAVMVFLLGNIGINMWSRK